MTANELADELTKMFRGEEYDRLIHEIPDMLRQQAEEIAMLKQIIDANNLQLNIGQLKKELALQRLSDFSQEIENEPVAWISVLAIDHIGQKFTDVRVSLTKTDLADIPLYTHPMRELSDEEIGEFKGQWYRGDFNSFYDLVQAILKKASEK